jgi:hypothetical protein
MSDLAPFVASVLYDRVLAETKQEVDHLTEQLRKSRAVQIISASGTVYAEGQFENGSYSGNPNLWYVKLPKQCQVVSCPLSDLADVEICIGGNCKAHFGFGSIVEGWLQRDGYVCPDGWAYINFCFAGAGWLFVKVGPFPSEDALFAQLGRDTDPVDPEFMASFLRENVAAIHPELSVIFLDVKFFASAVKGFIQNLNFDPAFEEEMQRSRQEFNEAIEERRNTDENVEDGTNAEDDAER